MKAKYTREFIKKLQKSEESLHTFWDLECRFIRPSTVDKNPHKMEDQSAKMQSDAMKFRNIHMHF